MDLHIIADLVAAATIAIGYALSLKRQAPARVVVRVGHEVRRDVTRPVHDK